MALFNIKLDLDETYINIIKQYLMALCIFIFLILLEPLDQINTLSLFFYTILGILFYNLILTQIISIN